MPKNTERNEERAVLEEDIRTNLDELTQVIHEAAEKMGITPKEFMQMVVDKFKDMRDLSNLSPVLDQLIAEAEGALGKQEKKAPEKNREDRDI